MPTVATSHTATPKVHRDLLTPEQIERKREKRRRRRRARKAKKAGDQAPPTPAVAVTHTEPSQTADISPSPDASPTAQLQAELSFSALQQESASIVATGHVCSCGTPQKPDEATNVSASGDAISSALLKLNDGVSGLINAFSPPLSRQVSNCSTVSGQSPAVDEAGSVSSRGPAWTPARPARAPLSASNSSRVAKPSTGKKPRASRAKYTPEERERRRVNRRLVRGYGYDMSEDDLDDLFPSCRRERGVEDYGPSESFWSGGSEKFEYTMSFINDCGF